MKLSKRSILYNALRNSLSIGAIFIFSEGFSMQEFNMVAAAAVTAGTTIILLVNMLWEYLVWRNYGFNIEDNSLRIKKGVLRKEDRKIPLDRVQNVDTKRNIVQRLMGISQVNVETAGGTNTEASLKHLTKNNASELKNLLRESKNEEETGKDPIYKIKKTELLLLSISSIDGRVLAVVGTIFGIAPAFVSSAIEQVNIGMNSGSVLLFTAGAGLTWLVGFASTLSKYWGFNLYESDKSLKYERGLFNRAEGEIPLKKVQKLTVEANIIQRTLNYASLKIDTAGYSITQSTSQGPEAALPLADKQTIRRLSNKIGNVDTPELEKITSTARTRYVFRYLLSSVTLSVVAVYMFESSVHTVVFFFGLLATASIFAGHLKWKNRGYKLSKEHAVISKGFWKNRTTYIPYFRVQNVIESRTILQRRWSLSTLDIDTAGTGNIINKTIISDLNHKNAYKLRKQVYKKFQESVKNSSA